MLFQNYFQHNFSNITQSLIVILHKILIMVRPLFVFGSRHGTIFNVTPALLSTYKIEALSLFVGDFYQTRQTFQNLPDTWNIKRFLGLSQNTKTYLTSYDYQRSYYPKVSNEAGHIKIQTDSGFSSLDVKKYNQMVNILKPDYTVGLTDYNFIQKDKINHKKTIDKLMNFLQHKDIPKNTKFLMPLPVFEDLAYTFSCLQAILMHDQIKGIVLTNLFQNETYYQKYSILDKIKERVQVAKKSQFQISIGGIGKISDIQPLLKFGATMFEVSYPFLMAAQHKAIIKVNNTYVQKTPELKDKLDPLSQSCTCYSCTRHNEAYIAHLIKCKQPNATILLSLHNLQVYMDLIAPLK